MKTHTIDATNKKIGRVATEAASLIMGKNLPTFKRNIVPDVKVIIENADKADITMKKKQNKTYSRYSGYPGGLKKQSMTYVINKKGVREIFKKAVYGMLPTNKLRPKMIKNLLIKE